MWYFKRDQWDQLGMIKIVNDINMEGGERKTTGSRTRKWVNAREYTYYLQQWRCPPLAQIYKDLATKGHTCTWRQLFGMPCMPLWGKGHDAHKSNNSNHHKASCSICTILRNIECMQLWIFTCFQVDHESCQSYLWLLLSHSFLPKHPHLITSLEPLFMMAKLSNIISLE